MNTCGKLSHFDGERTPRESVTFIYGCRELPTRKYFMAQNEFVNSLLIIMILIFNRRIENELSLRYTGFCDVRLIVPVHLPYNGNIILYNLVTHLKYES